VGAVKVASFEVNGRASYGVIRGGEAYEAGKDWRRRHPDLRAVLAADRLGKLPEACDEAPLVADDLSYLPVIPRPDKILCVGVNYRPHVEEMGRDIPSKPVVFVRFAGSVVGHRQPIVRPTVSEQYDFEGELAVVIGRRGRHVQRRDALDHVAGYTCFMDGSVRDWQGHTNQFTPGKNFDSSGAVGPCLATSSEITDPSNLQLVTRVNGEEMQSGRLDELIFDIPSLIEYCSTFTELLPGDLIATGTPGGVGAARTPPLWLRNGDTVEVEIDGVGVLRNPVRDES
jgi:2-keto-4-pentenoate hydratase/2-oxohepta-3-ene-1,7-dioic acid hydratase in catechol pathway